MTSSTNRRRIIEQSAVEQSASEANPQLAELFQSAIEVDGLSEQRVGPLWERLSLHDATPVVEPRADDEWFERMQRGERRRPSAKLIAWPRSRWVAGVALAALFTGGAVFAGKSLFVPSANDSSATNGLQNGATAVPQLAASDSLDETKLQEEASSVNNPEAMLLLKALTRMRRDSDPAGALKLLDEYFASFPSGQLASEASVARIEALLALGRRRQALVELEKHPLQSLPRGNELRVLRGELRGALGHCASAIEDFEALLASSAGEALKGRALFGRGSCRTRTGQHAAAQRDFRQYLKRYPQGDFADEARRALGID